MDNPMIKLGGVWESKDKNGNTYFSGGLTYGTRLFIMKNSYKEQDTHPDYIVYLAKSEPKDKDSKG